MSRHACGLIFFTALLLLIGILMVFNTSSAEMIDPSLQKDLHKPLLKQLFVALGGGFFALGIFYFGHERLLHHAKWLMVAFTVMLVLVFIPPIGQELNGASRWINLFGISFQPSEFAKILFPIFFIASVGSEELTLKRFVKLLGFLSAPFFLILIEPDNGSAFIIMATMVTLFFLMRIRLNYWLVPISIALALGTSVAIKMPHVKDRIQIYLHPEKDLLGKGHQPYQAKIAAGSGGIFGRGFGESLQKFNYLPEARSDYIAAIFAEEFGFVGILALMLLYLGLAYCGFQIALQAREQKSFLLAAILTFLCCFQAFLNLGVVSGLLPSKGTNLPFFSQGGTSLAAGFALIAILLSISRHSKGAAWRRKIAS